MKLWQKLPDRSAWKRQDVGYSPQQKNPTSTPRKSLFICECGTRMIIAVPHHTYKCPKCGTTYEHQTERLTPKPKP